MILAFITAIIVFVVGSFDELPVLIALFSTKKNKKEEKKIIIDFTIGHMLLVIISMIIAKFLGYLPRQELVGFTGLIPLMLGIDSLFSLKEKNRKKSSNISIISIIFITLGMGGDYLGVYIPLFITMSNNELLGLLPIYLLGTIFQLYLTKLLTEIKVIKNFTKKYTKLIIGIVFITLGIYIMYKLGTIDFILGKL